MSLRPEPVSDKHLPEDRGNEWPPLGSPRASVDPNMFGGLGLASAAGEPGGSMRLPQPIGGCPAQVLMLRLQLLKIRIYSEFPLLTIIS